MKKLYHIGGLYESIIVPSYKFVLQNIYQALSINDIKTNIEYETIKFNNNNYILNGSRSDLYGPARRFASIVINEDVINLPKPNTLFNNAAPIINDEVIDFTVVPWFNTKKINLQLVLHTKSRTEIDNLRTTLRHLASYDQRHIPTFIEYFYLIDNNIIALLRSIYVNMTNVKNIEINDDTFVDYLNEIGDGRLVVASNLGFSENKFQLGVRDEQIEIIAHIESDIVNTKYVLDEKGYYSLSIDLWFEMQIPEMLYAYYNIMNYGGVVPEEYLGIENSAYVDGTYDSSAYVNTAIVNGVISIPAFYSDYFVMRDCYKSLFRALVKPDENNLLLNLRDLGGIELNVDVLNYISDRLENVVNINQSPIYIYVRLNEKITDNMITIDSDLNVYYNGTYDGTVKYSVYVDLSICQDSLSIEAKEDIQNFVDYGFFTEEYDYIIGSETFVFNFIETIRPTSVFGLTITGRDYDNR